MNDAQLEERLARLRPARPGPDLMRRLRKADPRTARPRIAWPGWFLRAALLPAAAALLIVLLKPQPPAPVPSDTARYEPVEARDFIIRTEPLGIGHDAGGRPYRVLKGYGVRRAVWKNTDDGSEVTSITPHQHLLLARMDVY